jgi:predicted alpha/beta-hydrolase family hydrolase
MNISRFELELTNGFVTAELTRPTDLVCLLTLAHGAGAGMDHVFMVGLSQQLALHGIGTLRFNFPFMEGKKGRPDFPAVAHATIEAAVTKAATMFPGIPLAAAGKSFGGRMSSQWLAKSQSSLVKGVVFYGFPLHPPGNPATDRADHLKDVHLPMLFLQGTRDELATWDLVEGVCANLSSATLIRVEGADHAFKIPRKNSVELLAMETKQWLKKQKIIG